MIIDYEIVWVENEKLNFQQFSYEIDNTAIPLTSNLPDDLYKFYIELKNKRFPIIIFAGEKSNGTGLLRYCGANPVYEKSITGSLTPHDTKDVGFSQK